MLGGGTCHSLLLTYNSPKCKIRDILEPDGVNNLGEKEERKDPQGGECHGEDWLGVAPHSVCPEIEEKVRKRERERKLHYELTSAESLPG